MLPSSRQLSPSETAAMWRVITPLAELAHSTPRSVSRALIVNADSRTLPLVRLHLEARKYVVDYAANASEAISKVGDLQPDLVLLDVPAATTGCLDVLKFIRSENLDMAVIVLTSDPPEDLAIEALRFGADAYLRLPFKDGEFGIELDRVVNRLTAQRAM